MLGNYYPGNSLAHRGPAGWKLSATILFIAVTSFAAGHPWLLGAAWGILLGAYVLAQLPVLVVLKHAAVPIPVLGVLAAFRGWQDGVNAGAHVFLVLMACIMAATWLSLTTSTAELMDAAAHRLRPLEKWGVPVPTLVLILALTLRLLPRQMGVVREVLDARKARGLGFSLRAFFTPVVIRSLRQAESLSEALWARSIDQI